MTNAYPRRYLDELPEEHDFVTEYKLESSLGIEGGARFHKFIEGQIIANIENVEPQTIVGKVAATRLYLGVALNNECPAEEVFMSNRDTYEIGAAIFNFKENDYNAKIEKQFDPGILELDVLIIKSIEILPEYRGLCIGAYAIKDLINLFGGHGGLIVLDVFPGQFVEESDSGWRGLMKYNQLSIDFDASFKKLHSYFKKMGFVAIPGIARKLMFMALTNRNEEFDLIELD